MSLIPCRDCGAMIDPNSRGCPTCARNLDAERMIDKLVLAFIVAVIAAGAVVLLFLSRQ